MGFQHQLHLAVRSRGLDFWSGLGLMVMFLTEVLEFTVQVVSCGV